MRQLINTIKNNKKIISLINDTRDVSKKTDLIFRFDHLNIVSIYDNINKYI